MVDGNELLKFADAFPPSSRVDRDLFQEVDFRIPYEVLNRENLGNVYDVPGRVIVIDIPKACCFIKSSVCTMLDDMMEV